MFTIASNVIINIWLIWLQLLFIGLKQDKIEAAWLFWTHKFYHSLKTLARLGDIKIFHELDRAWYFCSPWSKYSRYRIQWHLTARPWSMRACAWVECAQLQHSGSLLNSDLLLLCMIQYVGYVKLLEVLLDYLKQGI